MAEKPFVSNAQYDSLFEFSAGMNSGVAAVLLPKNQLAYASNATVRGTFAQPRPPWVKYTLDYGGDTALQSAVNSGLWQGASFYKPDFGDVTLMASINGRLYQFTPQPNNVATVIDVTGGNAQSQTAEQAWLWQSEKWLVWNDGVSNPVFWDNTATFRSNFATQIDAGVLAVLFTYVVSTQPGDAVAITASVPYVGNVGDIITINFGTPNPPQFVVTLIGPGNLITGTNLNISLDTVHELTFLPGSTLTGRPGKLQLPPGRMGVYGLGRNWICLPDGRQFLASDIVGAASGTFANGFRDSVLFITENDYLVGGGTFTIPGNIGEIRAMRFTATLDAALGQGPLEIFTPTNAFSCQAPVDRLTWQTLQNPILTQSLIGNGAMGQNSTIGANSDTIFRSVDGIRSLILARRDFDVWGNTPISREMDIDLLKDEQDLLPFGSAVNFDNRLLMTLSPKAIIQNVPAIPAAIYTLSAGITMTDVSTVEASFVFPITPDYVGNVGDIVALAGAGNFEVTGFKPGFLFVVNLDFVIAPGHIFTFPLGTAISRPNSAPTTKQFGVYHRALIALNFDPLSSMRGKAPAVYDGSWIGANFFQLLTGEINFSQRCFAFTYNTSAQRLELIEILPGSTTEIFDNGASPIVWGFESPVIFRDQDPRSRDFKRLVNGEIFIDDLIGRVDFQVWYRPDDYPCWIPWLNWSECADNVIPRSTVEFRPAIGLGGPSSRACDAVTGRPFREGYYFQVKIQIQGQCRFKGARFMAVTLPDPSFAKPGCDAICGDVIIPAST